MKVIILILLFLTFVFSTKSQKPPIPPNAMDKWDEVQAVNISHDGKYIFYQGNGYIVIRDTSGKIQRKIFGAIPGAFTCDSRYFLFKLPSDSLMLLDLGKNKLSFLDYATSFKLSEASQCKTVAYLQADGRLIVRGFRKNDSLYWNRVVDFYFNSTGNHLYIRMSTQNDLIEELGVYDLNSRNYTKIWEGFRIEQICLSSLGGLTAFVVVNSAGEGSALWIYDERSKRSKQLINSAIIHENDTLYLSNTAPSFSSDLSKIFFSAKKKVDQKPKGSRRQSGLVIWSSSSDTLSYESSNFNNSEYIGSICFANNNICILAEEKERIELLDRADGDKQDFILVSRQLGNAFEGNWRTWVRPSHYLVSTSDCSKRVFLKDSLAPLFISDVSISPGNHYAIYFDENQNSYYSYNVRTNKHTNISSKIPFPISGGSNGQKRSSIPFGFELAAWFAEDKYLIIYDQYDLWRIDPDGVEDPVNITQEFGRKNNITLRLVKDRRIPVVKNNQKLLLTAFDNVSKFNGFYSLRLSERPSAPYLLTMGPFIYNLPLLSVSCGAEFRYPPIKARDKDVYLVRRMSDESSPNYFVTKDLVNFKQVTFIEPEREFNWIKAELMKYPISGEQMGEAIIYKPQNFDSTKKYPVLFYLYELLSNQLYQYRKPEPSSILNIPEFVSNGYLVVVPDIYYRLGDPGEGTYQSVLATYKYLRNLLYVDTSRVGIQGHSWGGYQVNYLITRTKIFKAAASAAGTVNFISSYGSSLIKPYMIEYGQSRLGANMWENLSLYIRNSPLFSVNKIGTPLLIMHNKKDNSVSYSQALELFIAMRRLGKTIWWLQYSNSDHEVQGNDAKDYAIKLRQYFDFFLKGAELPPWMK